MAGVLFISYFIIYIVSFRFVALFSLLLWLGSCYYQNHHLHDLLQNIRLVTTELLVTFCLLYWLAID